MSKEKTWLLIIIILLGMLPAVCFGISLFCFGLGLNSKVFFLLGVFYCCVISVCMHAILKNMQTGKKPVFIPIGLCMVICGFVFFGVLEYYPTVRIRILLSSLYVFAGLLTLVKGIKDRFDTKGDREFEAKQSRNKYGNIDSYDEEETVPIIEEAVKFFRDQIIAEITKIPAKKYRLASMLWQDVAKCFPEISSPWYIAGFSLDLQTRELSVDVITYPDKNGTIYRDSFPLSAQKFNSIAKQVNICKKLQAFKTDEDWTKLFDADLDAAIYPESTIVQKKEENLKQNEINNLISVMRAIVQKKEENLKSEENDKYAVNASQEYDVQTPNMRFLKIIIELNQRYSDKRITVTNEDGKYKIVCRRYSSMLSLSDRLPIERVLSADEAVCLEKRVENTIRNPDESTWQSLYGGDRMKIIIKTREGDDISIESVTPITKYSDLQDELEELAQHGTWYLS